MTNKLSAILLLCGYSKRFNYQNKLLMTINEKAIVDYVAEAIVLSNFFEVIAVCRECGVIEKVSKYNFKIVENNNAYVGISQSIKLGVTASSKEGRGYMFFQGDQIFITAKDIDILTREFDKDSSKIIVPVCDNAILSPVIFPLSCKEELLLLSDDNGGKVVINNNKYKIREVEIKNKNLKLDIDTLDDFNKAKNMLL